MPAIPNIATSALNMELLPNGGAKLRLSMNITHLVTMVSFMVLSASTPVCTRQVCAASSC